MKYVYPKHVCPMSTLNITKFASLKKIHTKLIIMKRNMELNDLGFLFYSAKACPDLSWVFMGSFFQSLYHTSLISLRWEINGTVNFRICHKLFANKFDALFVAFWHPHFETGKINVGTRR